MKIDFNAGAAILGATLLIASSVTPASADLGQKGNTGYDVCESIKEAFGREALEIEARAKGITSEELRKAAESSRKAQLSTNRLRRDIKLRQQNCSP